MDRTSGKSFEQACADLFRKFGFTHVSNIGGPGDCGADITAYRGNTRILAQCKNYTRHAVGSPDVNSFAGAIHNRRSTQYHHDQHNDYKHAYLFTTTYFTKPAIEAANYFNNNAKCNGLHYFMELQDARDLNYRFEHYKLPWHIDDKGRLIKL